MLRPKRSAAQKSKPQEKDKKAISDVELDLSEESDGDFSSASSDEWGPTKNKIQEETFEESESEADATESEDEDGKSGTNAESPVKLQKKSRGNRSLVATLRGTTGNKFKRNQANRSTNLQDILQRAQYQKPKSIFDDTQNGTKEKTPEFDCSGGLRLSGESSGSEDDDGPSTSSKVPIGKKKTTADVISKTGITMLDLKAINDNFQQMENAKAKLLDYESSKKSSGSQMEFNIADLLAMGEASAVEPSSSTSQKKSSQKKRSRHTQGDESDSDGGWEEVEDDESAPYETPKEGVEIMLNDFNQQHGKKKDAKPVDLEAQMKRKLNRRRKEYQVWLHKTNLMLWIAHGNSVNRKLNDTNLMASALKLLPKNDNHCYPKDETDLDYFKQVTKWFKSTVKLGNKSMYTMLKQRPPVMMSLALQMQFKAAICRRDYVLIFTILLRAIGIQCRMVQSLVCAPIMPPKSELLSLSTKKPEEKPKPSLNRSKSKSSGSSKSSQAKSSTTKRTTKPQPSTSTKSEENKSPAKSSRSSRSKAKNPTKQPIIPQLDGNDDEASSSKSRRPLKIKALLGYKVDESFVDINKDQNSNSKVKKNLKVATESPRSKSKAAEIPSVTKMAPKVRFSLDSPNRNSDKLFKAGTSKSGQAAKNLISESSKLFSPRKTRAKSRVDAPNEESSKQKTLKKKLPENIPEVASKRQKVTLDTLQVFSPRRLRSRSRSNEDVGGGEPTKKPNLKNLRKTQTETRPGSSKTEVEAEMSKDVTKAVGKKRPAVTNSEVASKKAKSVMKKAIAEKKDSDDTDDSDKLFKPKSLQKKVKPTTSSSFIDRRVLSSDDNTEQSPKKNSKGIDIWVEVYSEKDKRWIAIDVLKGKVDCVEDVVKTATHPMVYVFAWNNDKSLKDVSARYCTNFNTTVRKMRVEPTYLASIVGQFQGIKTARDVKEDDELNAILFKIPMPTSISQFKNHPLYALKRHLLKFQAIYPPEPPILGYIRDEAIYPRDCVFVLHTRETWLKEARVVKLHEEPYKITLSLKWDNVNKKILRDIPQELFGIWQTKDYEPPVAENGMVPRNAYGNVELFKPCMLPIGTVHLQLPGLNKVCKKIGVDCSQAIVGFDANSGWPYPVYDGFVVCQEFQEKVIDAWNREQEEIEKKENEKYEKRVYGNWKKLIKGLFIRQRLKNKYNFEGDQ